MTKEELRELLTRIARGETDVDTAIQQMRLAPIREMDFAVLDHHRSLRQGTGEVIYGEGKTAEQIDRIAHALYEDGQNPVIVTRMSPEAASTFTRDIPFSYHELARIGVIGQMPAPNAPGYILVLSAGTSDIPVAEEAALTAELLGNEVHRVFDVGVAGIHRLLAHAEDIMGARVIIAVAGMEGALPSVVGGLADCPVIAVPTSVGYGASLNGIAALLSMLNSCASGVSVVNIDNGFGAGFQASMINHMK